MPGSLAAVLREAMSRHAAAGRTAIDGPLGTVSYGELLAAIDGFAGAMRDWGVARGDRVALLLPRLDTVTAFFGMIQAGGCACVLEPRLKPAEIAARLAAVGARRLVVGAADAALAGALPGVDVREMRGLRGEAFAGPALAATDDAMMQFTSGSTGLPKGVLLTHGNLLANARGVIAHTGVTPADRLLHVMPLHHTNGINNQLIVPFVAGATVVLIDRFKAEDVAAQIGTYHATYMTGVPTMYSRILAHVGDRAQLATLRFLRCGSAPITVALHEQIEAAFGVPLVVSYGLSEATCTSTMNPPGARRVGTIGTVIAGQEVKLFRAGTCEEVARGSDGEICIAGPCLMKGYVGEGVEQPVKDGWLRTGDLGRFDADGYLSITGRIKDVIIRGGENLSPQMIEGVLATHPAVRACCVVGAPDADLGEVPVAFVVLRAGMAATDVELQALVGERLSRMYIPTAIRFRDALPENSVGKVDRKALQINSTQSGIN
jgi:acyl-CoA synthetase (AMP-forming)/AMP-acid ligase II